MEPTAIEQQVSELVAIASALPERAISTDDLLRLSSGAIDHDFYNLVALEVAHKFQAGALSYAICDVIMNGLWAFFLQRCQNEPEPSPFSEIFEAFDAGEYYRTADHSDDPVQDHTVPMIEKILSEISRRDE